jgi:hypothetical protein
LHKGDKATTERYEKELSAKKKRTVRARAQGKKDGESLSKQGMASLLLIKFVGLRLNSSLTR